MNKTGFTAGNISVALIISGLLHLLLFYLPGDRPVYQDQSLQQTGHVEIELVKSSIQTSPLQPEKHSKRVDDTDANMDADVVAANADSLKTHGPTKKTSPSESSPEPVDRQDRNTLSRSLAENPADSSSVVTQNDPNHLLKLIYTEINKHKHYPYVARRLGREGLVKLNFVMHPDGEVTDIAIVQTSHFSALDNAARNAVQAISPFRRAAEFLDSYHRYDVNIDFRLN